MIHINDEILNRVSDYSVYKNDFPVIALEGRDEFNILCPVSVVTGHRTSLQEAILHLSQDNMELANSIIENLDSSYSDERLSVSERLDLVKERLSSGSFAEDDGYMASLEKFIQLNYPQMEVSVESLGSVSKEADSSPVVQNE